MKWLSVVIYFIINRILSGYCIDIEGYYWREYAGAVPGDALAGGVDHNGNNIYIGQILYKECLLTAKIYPREEKAYYGWDGKEYTGTKNIKILCTQTPEKFVWVPTKHNELHLLTGRHIVLGAHEPGYTIYIGRAFYNLETLVGKISTGKTENLGLYITHDGEEINLKSFEILTYDPSIKATISRSNQSNVQRLGGIFGV